MDRKEQWKPKWGIKAEDIADPHFCKVEDKWRRAKSKMETRTAGFNVFTLISHNQSLFKEKGQGGQYSEGTTQAIKRKILAQTIQRVPDGEITTQYDKNSIEQVEIEYFFKNKVLTSEYDNKDMLKNITKAFKASYDYGFACVRTGFEKDLDGDVRISWTQIGYNDIFPAPDAKYIEEAEWYIVREWISRADLRALLDEEGNILDPTYEENTVKFLLDSGPSGGIDTKSAPLADQKKGSTPTESVEIITLYMRHRDEFTTYVPSANAVLRRVKNYDPRKDVPLHFLILEPDPEFPLGCSSVMWTLGQQQFADAFQTLSYQALQLAINPPLMGYGYTTIPQIKMKPHAFWPLGTNTNTKIEKFPVETTTITQYGSVLENVSGNMMKNLNVTDGTVASDANVSNYSGTPQGVQEQHLDKTITINSMQKRVEVFFGDWANHALRSYINSSTGTIELTVDEETRRRIWDIEMANEAETSIIDGDKISVDFDAISADLLEFHVRTGSLVENEKELERKNIQELLIPISQMLGNLSEGNRQVFEQNIMQLVARLCELSNVDISQQTANRINEKMLMDSMQATMEAVMAQQQQIAGQQQQLNDISAALGVAPQAPQPEVLMDDQGLPMEAQGAPIEAPIEPGPLPAGEGPVVDEEVPIP